MEGDKEVPHNPDVPAENGVAESLTNGNSEPSEPNEPAVNGNSVESPTETPTEETSEKEEVAVEAPKESPKAVEEEKETKESPPPPPPSRKRKAEEEKCPEQGCDFKSWYDDDMKFHVKNTHGFKIRIYKCGNCQWTCNNKWEMDYHCRARGHKVLKEECIPCKKCDFLAETKDDAMAHKKVHIDPDKLFECGGDECVYVSDRLDNLRYHVNANDHAMKTDYEKIAEDKAAANGPTALKHYKQKYARDVKKARQAKK